MAVIKHRMVDNQPTPVTTEIWSAAMEAITRTLPQIRTSLDAWWADDFLTAARDHGTRMAPVMAAALGTRWGPLSTPTADPLKAWDTAHTQAPWAYAMLSAWQQEYQERWGDESNEEPPRSLWLPLIEDFDAGLKTPVAESHWRLWARQCAVVIAAGVPQDAQVKALLERWELGWPRALGGSGLVCGTIDVPLNVPENNVVGSRSRAWRGLGETLMNRAMVHHVEHLREGVSTAVWVPTLHDLRRAREGQPETQFPDPTLRKAADEWVQRVKEHASKLNMKADFRQDLHDFSARRALWAEHRKSLAPRCKALLRDWMTPPLSAPAPSEDGPERRGPRVRLRS